MPPRPQQEKDDDWSSSSSVDSQQEALEELLGFAFDDNEWQEEEDDDLEHSAHHNHPTTTIRRISLPMHCSRHGKHPDNCFAIAIPNVLTATECQALIALGASTPHPGASGKLGYDYVTQAFDSTTNSMVYLPNPNPHKLAVFFHDSWRTVLWNRLRPHLPVKAKARGLNPKLRILRYDAHHDDCFAPHYDATTVVGGEHADYTSQWTVLLYLNDDFEGGHTLFLNHDNVCATNDNWNHNEQDATIVTPRTGTVVLFEHDLYHASTRLLHGTKYVLRTDVLFDTPSVLPAAETNMQDKQKTKRTTIGPLVSEWIVAHPHLLSPRDYSILQNDLHVWNDSLASFCAPGPTALQAMLQDVGLSHHDSRTLVQAALAHVKEMSRR